MSHLPDAASVSSRTLTPKAMEAAVKTVSCIMALLPVGVASTGEGRIDPITLGVFRRRRPHPEG
ncbi:hypothetical protein VY88_23505 [Azospirillum thiophilum]|uniref:hypothetical protein n=1 Tax=Azospirillum thiophilum TaxID=528244 RepID=UPI00061E7FF6|nr:hypothetical protein [Azospirillum thiophilum]KJR63131.1 hypothetical protein VY88_23505 [Azospirillum thiophilum]